VKKKNKINDFQRQEIAEICDEITRLESVVIEKRKASSSTGEYTYRREDLHGLYILSGEAQ
jgi:hypothetical protein